MQQPQGTCASRLGGVNPWRGRGGRDAGARTALAGFYARNSLKPSIRSIRQALRMRGLAEARRGAEPGRAPRASGQKERLSASGLTRTLYYAHVRVPASAPRGLHRCPAESPPGPAAPLSLPRRLVPCACKRTDDGLVFRDGQLLQTV